MPDCNRFSFRSMVGSVTAMTQSTAFKTEWDKLFIGGKWVEPATSDVIEVHSPATGELVGKVPLASAADVDAACAAARKAFDEGPWPQMSPDERAEILGRAVKLMEERGAQPCDVAQLSERAQVDDIKRIFKITPEELETGSLADAVTTRIGVRDVM